jgi:lipid-A-disaccharide synthase-like uncharacterized protein
MVMLMFALIEVAGEARSVTDWVWMGVGFLGQGIFGARVLVQWIASERARRSIVPVAFWYMSIAGATITLAYAIRIWEPVFIVSQIGGLIAYLRNLYLIRHRAAQEGVRWDGDA